MIGASKICAAITGALFLLVVNAAPGSADESADSQQFVRTLADKAISQLTDSTLSAGEREQRFRVLLGDHFDVPGMGRSALGRFWRIATPDEQKEYLALFEDLIVATYANRFRDYGGENLDITNVVKSSGTEDVAILVQSQIVRNVAKPIRVDWRVARASGDHKIVDVVIEGVSMMQTQRSEFSSVITRGGGKVASLNDELRTKTKSLLSPNN